MTKIHAFLPFLLIAIAWSTARASAATKTVSADDELRGMMVPPEALRSRFGRTSNGYGSHYFIGPSAISVQRGEGWYKNTMVSFNSATYGLTEHLSVHAGIDLVSLVSSRSNGPLWTTRLQVSGTISDAVHLGAMATYLRVPLPRTAGDQVESGTSGGFGAGLVMITIGDPDHQLTIAGGLPYDGSDRALGPLLYVAGATRLFPNVSLVTEHWLLADPNTTFSMHSLGARIIGHHLAIDLGVAYDELYAVKVTPIGTPFVSATLNF